MPSPYALKMALLDAAIRVDGWGHAEFAWAWLARLQIGIQLPDQMVVTNLFAKILKIRRNPAKEGAADAGPFQKTIAYREYVYFSDKIQFVLGTDVANHAALARYLLNITYLGKRGGFVQLMGPPTGVSDTTAYTVLTEEMTAFPPHGLMQRIDDCDSKMKLDQANIYTKSRPKRVVRDVVLPYRLKKSSRSYSLYERVT